MPGNVVRAHDEAVDPPRCFSSGLLTSFPREAQPQGDELGPVALDVRAGEQDPLHPVEQPERGCANPTVRRSTDEP